MNLFFIFQVGQLLFSIFKEVHSAQAALPGVPGAEKSASVIAKITPILQVVDAEQDNIQKIIDAVVAFSKTMRLGAWNTDPAGTITGALDNGIHLALSILTEVNSIQNKMPGAPGASKSAAVISKVSPLAAILQVALPTIQTLIDGAVALCKQFKLGAWGAAAPVASIAPAPAESDSTPAATMIGTVVERGTVDERPKRTVAQILADRRAADSANIPYPTPTPGAGDNAGG